MSNDISKQLECVPCIFEVLADFLTISLAMGFQISLAYWFG